jgi:polar amino acid transport system permease protein
MLDLRGFGAQLAEGTALTIELALASATLGTLLGLAFAALKLSGAPVVRAIADVYTTVFRGVPELIIVLIVYFGASIGLSSLSRAFGAEEPIELHPFIAGTLAMGLAFGAYATEVFRGALQAVPRGQMEAARAFGMSRFLAFRRVALPQVWRFALPGLGNVWLLLLKGTAIISVVGLEELARKADMMTRNVKAPFTVYGLTILIFLGLTVLSEIVLKTAEKRAAAGVRRA